MCLLISTMSSFSRPPLMMMLVGCSSCSFRVSPYLCGAFHTTSKRDVTRRTSCRSRNACLSITCRASKRLHAFPGANSSHVCSKSGFCLCGNPYGLQTALIHVLVMALLTTRLVRTRGIRLLLAHMQILLAVSHATGDSTLAAADIAADPASCPHGISPCAS